MATRLDFQTEASGFHIFIRAPAWSWATQKIARKDSHLVLDICGDLHALKCPQDSSAPWVYLFPDWCTAFESVSLLPQGIHSELPVGVLNLLFPAGVFPEGTRCSGGPRDKSRLAAEKDSTETEEEICRKVPPSSWLQ